MVLPQVKPKVVMTRAGIVDTEDARAINRSDPEGPERSDGDDAHGLTIPATVERRLGEGGVGALWALYAVLNVFPPSHVRFAPWLVIPLCVLASLHFLRSWD